MNLKKIFVTGISTEVGKTIISAILTEAIKADYWKPVQAGELEYCDSEKVKNLISNNKTVFHKNSYALKTPMSPHAAAEKENIRITLDKIIEPKTSNHLVIEGAGGLLVPLNERNTILDLIKNDYEVVLVSRHYLGSINHTLMSIKILQEKRLNVSIIFSGDEHPTTESIISKMSDVRILGRVKEEEHFTPAVISKYAKQFKDKLLV